MSTTATPVLSMLTAVAEAVLKTGPAWWDADEASQFLGEPDGDFVVVASPQTILALLDSHERLRKALEEACVVSQKAWKRLDQRSAYDKAAADAMILLQDSVIAQAVALKEAMK